MKKNNPSNNNGIPSRGQGHRVNPMNQINNALNNYVPSKRMNEKYGKFANISSTKGYHIYFNDNS